mmetsp:Transcript_38147/g.89469  ORF Transcript_38147/g.89469 Transcript_38147/m.89469 type:complete len:95 (-) Transcript_38147:1254-1538(-)
MNCPLRCRTLLLKASEAEPQEPPPAPLDCLAAGEAVGQEGLAADPRELRGVENIPEALVAQGDESNCSSAERPMLSPNTLGAVGMQRNWAFLLL